MFCRSAQCSFYFSYGKTFRKTFSPQRPGVFLQYPCYPCSAAKSKASLALPLPPSSGPRTVACCIRSLLLGKSQGWSSRWLFHSPVNFPPLPPGAGAGSRFWPSCWLHPLLGPPIHRPPQLPLCDTHQSLVDCLGDSFLKSQIILFGSCKKVFQIYLGVQHGNNRLH